VADPLVSGRRRLGLLLVLAGLALSLVSVIQLAKDDDAPPAVTAASSSQAVQHSSPEDPAAFLRAFSQALRTGDNEFLFDRLAPAVLARYGADQCRTSLAAAVNSPTLEFALQSASAPATFAWTTDGLTDDLADVLTLQVTQTVGGQSTLREVHFPMVDGQLRWLTDCGDPI
jgi:hypothetical protein